MEDYIATIEELDSTEEILKKIAIELRAANKLKAFELGIQLTDRYPDEDKRTGEDEAWFDVLRDITPDFGY